MSEMPPPSDLYGQPPSPPPPFDYYSPSEDNAPGLVRLAVIFNYISIALDACLSLLEIGAAILFLAAPNLAPNDPGDLPPWILGLIYLVLGIVVAALAIVKVIGTRKLQLARPNAWGWGLAVGIIGCAQLLCGSCCCLQVAGGVYTVIVLSFQNVRLHLAAIPDQQPPNPA